MTSHVSVGGNDEYCPWLILGSVTLLMPKTRNNMVFFWGAPTTRRPSMESNTHTHTETVNLLSATHFGSLQTAYRLPPPILPENSTGYWSATYAQPRLKCACPLNTTKRRYFESTHTFVYLQPAKSQHFSGLIYLCFRLSVQYAIKIHGSCLQKYPMQPDSSYLSSLSAPGQQVRPKGFLRN